MLRFFCRPAVPAPDDLCLVHSPPGPTPLFRPSPAGCWALRSSLPWDTEPGLFLGEVGDQGVRALWSVEVPVPEGETWVPLRQLLGELEPDQLKAAVRAAELSSWRTNHRFCGACGTPTLPRATEFAFECPRCGAEFWPRVTPAVITLIHRDDEVLLARHRRSSGPVYSCVAGFVEAGETLEEAVVREIAEEVGVKVGAPVYLGSQAWPFPHALMTAFLVPWASGNPVPDGDEILDAQWFRRDTLPQLPPGISIARRLIREFFRDPQL